MNLVFFKENMMEIYKSKVLLITSMLIFGTIGIFKQYISLPSGAIAFFRGGIGTIFLIALMLIRGKKINFSAIKKNIIRLCLSGAALGFNWMLLFKAMDFTTIPIATLCYYMAPVFVIVLSPVLFGEKLSMKKIICIIGAIVGIIMVSGIFTDSETSKSQSTGILFGLAAAVLYASVVLINKKTDGIEAEDRTIVQLGIAAVVLLPYTVFAENFDFSGINMETAGLLALVGIVHTGIAYALYFGSLKNIKAQTAALFSYIDPVSAIILSAVILNQKMDIFGIVGAIMVLGFTLLNELVFSKKD